MRKICLSLPEAITLAQELIVELDKGIKMKAQKSKSWNSVRKEVKQSLFPTRCSHRSLEVKTEEDRCSWVQCTQCELEGPAAHSITLALIAWAVAINNQNPRRRGKN